MKNEKKLFKIFSLLIIVLTLIVTICGVLSFDMSKTYEVINQYGQIVKIWGSGIYRYDSYFKVPIFVGSDMTILIFVVPFAIYTFIKTVKEESLEYYIRSFGVISLLLYYSASIAFGVTYNSIHLVYIALFSVCFFSLSLMLAKLHTISIVEGKNYTYKITKGMKVFLVVSAIALFGAWLPDIIKSLVNNTSLDLIEVYTTEVTYVLDMGVISPLMLLTYFLIKNDNFMGYILLRMSLLVCIGVGIMLPIQSVFQILSGYQLTLPVIITKVGIFVLLAGFSLYFDLKLRKSIKKTNVN